MIFHCLMSTYFWCTRFIKRTLMIEHINKYGEDDDNIVINIKD